MPGRRPSASGDNATLTCAINAKKAMTSVRGCRDVGRCWSGARIRSSKPIPRRVEAPGSTTTYGLMRPLVGTPKPPILLQVIDFRIQKHTSHGRSASTSARPRAVAAGPPVPAPQPFIGTKPPNVEIRRGAPRPIRSVIEARAADLGNLVGELTRPAYGVPDDSTVVPSRVHLGGAPHS
jgi:hypothetical protein